MWVSVGGGGESIENRSKWILKVRPKCESRADSEGGRERKID